MSTHEADRLNRIADSNRRQDEVLESLERIEMLLQKLVVAPYGSFTVRTEETLPLLNTTEVNYPERRK